MMDIQLLRLSIHLLPEPGPEAAGLILDEVERLQAQLAIAMEAIEEISIQRQPEEMDEEDRERADFHGGYSACINAARSAQAKMRGEK